MTLRDRLQHTLGTTFTIERELGGGGMSRVFLATETAFARRVVVKVLPAEMSGQLSVERFKREISIAARLQHAHIVPLLAAGEVDGLPYFTMPFVEGESLRAQLNAQREISVADAVRMLREIASALSYAHAHDVVHRDIKPDNVLLSGGAAMVTDFGVAKALHSANSTNSEGLTSVGMSLGTPAYMSPEQATADPLVDHRADIYAWGMLAYELLTGQSPFAGRTPRQMVAAQVTEAPEDIRKRRADLPLALAQLVMRSIEKAPDSRPQSADELVRALDAPGTLSGGASLLTPVANALRRRIAALGGALLLIAVIGGAWYAKRSATVAAPANEELTLAVLPIENIGGDSTTEYLADGMTGELSSALKKIPGLQVSGEMSTARFKHTHESPANIARQLGVHLLLTGKLQPGVGRVRVQMQLIDTLGRQLWAHTFNSASKDNFAMQDSITGDVASEMRLVLSPKTVAITRAGRTVNAEAHDLVMRGQFEKNRVTEQGLRNAIVYFKQALALDPHYAQANAGLAFSYDILADVYAPSHEYHTLALEAAKKAVEDDSLLPEARTIYGYEIAAANWDFPGGLAEMKRGLALNPNSTDALFIMGLYHWVSGNEAKAVEFAERLKVVDPLSPLAARLKADALLWGEKYPEALLADSIASAIDPTVQNAEQTKASVLRDMGRYDEAVSGFLAFEKAFNQPSWGLAMTYGRMGKRNDALRVIQALEERRKTHWVDGVFIGMGYAAIGDKDKAMEWFETAGREKSFSLRAFMNWDFPWTRSMNSDPRFVALRKRVLTTTF